MGTFGALLEYGCEERVSSHSSLGATMVVGTTGVTCKLKLSRASQTYLFPFHLSDEVMLQPVFYGTVVPLLGWLTVKKLLLEPLEKRRKQEEERKQKEQVAEQAAQSLGYDKLGISNLYQLRHGGISHEVASGRRSLLEAQTRGRWKSQKSRWYDYN